MYASICHMKRTTVFIEPELERELQALARRNGRPMASLVREAVAQYVTAAKAGEARRLGFIAAGRSGRRDVADSHEELLFEAGRTVAQPRRTTGAASRRRRRS